MKNLLLALFTVLTGFQSYAGSGAITCSTYKNQINTMLVLADQLRIHCSEGYYAAINGIGIGLQATGGAYVISCIGSTDSDLQGTFYGAKADANLIFGLSGSAYVGKKGVCVVGGANVGFGAGVSISTLQIYK